MERKQENRNILICSLMQAAYGNALLFISGSYVQLFLANRGVATSRIGLYNSIIGCASLLATMLLSGIAERRGNALRQSRRLMLWLAAAYVPMMLLAQRELAPGALLPLVAVISVAATILSAARGVLDFKVPYQIIDMTSYGRFSVCLNAVAGIFGLVMNLFFSALISSGRLSNPYLAGMAISAGMLLAAYGCSRCLRVINHDFDELEKPKQSAKDIWKVLSAPNFRLFLIPNLLRGISMGIAGSVALIALTMGYSEGLASTLPAAAALGTLSASLLFRTLEPRWSLAGIGGLGLLLMCVFVFPPAGNGRAFVLLYCVYAAGRLIVDTVIPVMVMRFIEPDTAGIYNAWRSILASVSSTVTVYLVGLFLEAANPRILLAVSLVTYAVCMGWYAVLYGRFQREGRRAFAER